MNCSKCNKFSFGQDELCINCQIKENEEEQKRLLQEQKDAWYNSPSLAELTEKYMAEGDSLDDAFYTAKRERGTRPF